MIRYYRPRSPTHEAAVLCSHLARFVQDEIDLYAQYHENYPPASNRPRGALYIVDRSMDLYAPFIHEFTYQAMAHDLLPIKDGEKVTYRTVVNEGRSDAEEKELEISEKDKIWVENRHRHMKDTIEKLMSEFQNFLDQNPHFTDTDAGNASSLNAIKDMLAGLPQFQELKEAYSLHLSMAQESMNIFQSHKLPDLASVEQVRLAPENCHGLMLMSCKTLATGLDEDYRKPKNVADQVVRTLDEESIVPSDRLRLIALYLLYKDGLLPSDLQKLLAHAQLPPQQGEVLTNLDLLGATVAKALKDSRPSPQPLFMKKQALSPSREEYSLSRFDPALKLMLQHHVQGNLDQTVFPYTKPHLDANDSTQGVSATSLRSAKPTWAKSRTSSTEPRQRVIVFMAGGATFSESRACYEISRETSRDVFLATSHMLTPGLFMQQLADLSVDKRRLRIPAEMPKPKAPAHLFEREEAPAPKPLQQQTASGLQKTTSLPAGPKVPTAAMSNMTLGRDERHGSAPTIPQKVPAASRAPGAGASDYVENGGGKLTKGPDKKKKHHFFSSKK